MVSISTSSSSLTRNMLFVSNALVSPFLLLLPTFYIHSKGVKELQDFFDSRNRDHMQMQPVYMFGSPPEFS